MGDKASVNSLYRSCVSGGQGLCKQLASIFCKCGRQTAEPQTEDETCVFPHHVFSEVEVIKKVEEAIESRKSFKKPIVLRVVGSEHSAREAIYSESNNYTTKLLHLAGDLKSVEKGKECDDHTLFRVGAGCRIGKIPSPPQCADNDAFWEDSLCYKVEKWGCGIPVLGGVTYQTIGGFLMTGSTGGTLKHGFSDFVHEIEFVDGNATKQTANRVSNPDLWSAVGVSMGLLGIVTYVTLKLPKVVYVQGKEEGYEYKDSSLRLDDCPEGETNLEKSLKDNEYFRLNWFPQDGVNRVQEWSGNQAREPTETERKPYKTILANPIAALGASVILGIGNNIVEGAKRPEDPSLEAIFTLGLKLFVPIDQPTEFYDTFYRTLPMDNDVHVYTFIRVSFTEIWMPISKCRSIIEKLNALFAQNKKAAGNFATEIYAAKKSEFWLGMSQGGDYVRVDPYWWQGNCFGDMREFFTYFWEALLDLGEARLHWGKYLPKPGQKCGETTFNLAYLKDVYPKMGDWLAKREECDPHQIFVTEYWRDILEIESPSAKK